jgi:AcrR family transcriptional regulator
MTETSQVHARHDTRQRIQSVALELFAEQGYDKTSLREIAERLDVTKAALYYHFKSKEDIVSSLVEDYFGQIDDLVAWGRTLPRTAGARAQVLDRYYRIVAEASGVFRMLQHNQASVNSLAHAKNRSELFRERMDALVGLLTEQDELRLHVLRRSHRRPGATARHRARHRLRAQRRHGPRRGWVTAPAARAPSRRTHLVCDGCANHHIKGRAERRLM